jgi:hypothetical protein
VGELIQMSIDDVETLDSKVSKMKVYKISELNRSYLDSFQTAKYPDIDNNKSQRSSYYQYKCTISNFLEGLGKDVAMCKREDIDTFLSSYDNSVTKGNKAAHIKSFLTFLITENIKNCTSKVSRDILIKLLQM